MQQLAHAPVLLEEILSVASSMKAARADDAVANPIRCVDATFGGGGHASALAAQSGAALEVLGIDRDPAAIARGQDLFGNQISHLRVSRFSQLENVLESIGWKKVDLVLFDYGISSIQLDHPERGFAFVKDGPLDMRMEQNGISAADLINRLPQEDLANLIYRFGDEPRSRTAAKAIDVERRVNRITSTVHLANTLARALGGRGGKRIHPATRTFMALRIAVNDELREIARGLRAAELVLNPKGVFAAVTFHSLEDRIVKRFVRAKARLKRVSKSQRISKSIVAGSAQDHALEHTFEVESMKPVIPTDKEIRENPRSRSAKLRYAVRTVCPVNGTHPTDFELGAWGINDIISKRAAGELKCV